MVTQLQEAAISALQVHVQNIGSRLAQELFIMQSRAARLLDKLDVQPPCIVVLGNENHGKSTLLGRLVGLPLFPRGKGLCTRMVIRVELRRGAATMATVEVVDRSTATAFVVSSTQCALDALEATIEDMMSGAMKKHGPGATVLLTHELHVHVQQPNFPTLDLIDVPGLVVAARKGQSADTPQKTLAVAKSVIERYKDMAMFLVVVDSCSTANVSLAAPLISKEVAKRALGVWTKLDVFADENHNESVALEKKLHDDTLELRFGWCACCTVPCSGDSETVDQTEAKRLHERGFEKHVSKVGLPAIRKLVQHYCEEFIGEHWLPLVLGPLKDCLREHAATYAELGLPSGPRATSARNRALKALRSIVRCPLNSPIAMDLEPVPVTKLVKLLEEATKVVEGYAGDHTALDVPAIDAELKLLRAMVAAPPEHVPLNNAAVRLEKRRTAAAVALRKFAVLVGNSVKGRDGHRSHMLAALDSHPSKWLQRFPKVKAALASRLYAAIKEAVSSVQDRALDLIAASEDKLVEFHLPEASGAKTAVISTAPLVFCLAEQVFEWYLTALHKHCGWEALRQLIPSEEAAWAEVEREASMNRIAEAAEVLKYFSHISLRVTPEATTGDDRDLLLAAFSRRKHNWTRNKPLSEWKGVERVDAAGNVTSLDMSNCYMSGTPDFTKLPKMLSKLDLRGNHFSGTPDLTKLPKGLQSLYLNDSEFSGTPDLTELPETLLELHLQKNRFSGTPDITKLPRGLAKLCMNENRFSGMPDLTELPKALSELHLQKNRFCGTPDLTKLPEGLVKVYLNDNEFSGTPDFTELPKTLLQLYLQKNQFCGTPDLTKLPGGLAELYLNENRFSGMLDLTKLPVGLLELSLSKNQFCGTPDLTKLPLWLAKLHLNNNLFSGTPDFTKLPKTLLELHLNDNELSGTPDLTKVPETLLELYLNENRFSASPDLTKPPAEASKVEVEVESALPEAASLTSEAALSYCQTLPY